MERQIRGAKSITSVCNSQPSSQISFIDQYSNPVNFSCNNVNQNGQASSIASSSADLTSGNISISQCYFICSPASGSNPTVVTIALTASDLTNQNAPISSITQVTLRSY
jgi:hypothetical protein